MFATPGMISQISAGSADTEGGRVEGKMAVSDERGGPADDHAPLPAMILLAVLAECGAVLPKRGPISPPRNGPRPRRSGSARNPWRHRLSRRSRSCARSAARRTRRCRLFRRRNGQRVSTVPLRPRRKRSVALYSLADPRLLAEATQEMVGLIVGLDLLKPERRVLEIGCGIGRFAARARALPSSIMLVSMFCRG